jgi:putative peptide zinc metalloprotease protein
MLAASIEPGSFGIGYLLFLCSLLVHELGHAAACVRYGARPGAIGATMY